MSHIIDFRPDLANEQTDNVEHKRIPRIAVIYTHFPHYRQAVFDEMERSEKYRFSFFYDPSSFSETIQSGKHKHTHSSIRTRKFGPLLFQARACGLVLSGQFDGFIFLGNPYIATTWIAAALARLKGYPVFFWTHGWLRRDARPKAITRNIFYRLANGLLLYGTRSSEIGEAEGYPPDRIHVINNSLDYAAQKKARELALSEGFAGEDIPDKPFFLSVSRLVWNVDLGMAIEAMKLLPQEATLVIVGAGPERNALEAQARKMSVDVRFTGAIYEEDQLARFFLNARAVVSPGKVGLLAMHALAYGVPVITHDDMDRQMPEVEAIDAEVTGAFFRYGDVVDLARQMAIFLKRSPEEQAVTCAAAIARIEGEYTPKVQVERITAALDKEVRRGA